MKRVFFDANVLFTAAHNPSGKAALVVDLGEKGRWKLITSSYAAEEARHNMALKFPSRLTGLEQLLAKIENLRSGSGQRCPVPLPDKDRPILEAAIHGSATHLLTGDLKHFDPCMNRSNLTGNVTIQTVAGFLESIATE